MIGKNEYNYVDVSDINITGEILPIREKNNPGSGRYITAEDVAFVTEAIIDRSNIGTVYDLYSVSGSARSKASSMRIGIYSSIGKYDKASEGFIYGVHDGTGNVRGGFSFHGADVRFSDIVKVGNEHLLIAWIKAVFEALNVITLASAYDFPTNQDGVYSIIAPDVDISKLDWLKLGRYSDVDYRVPLSINQYFGNCGGWYTGTGTLWNTYDVSKMKEFLLYDLVKKIFDNINTIKKIIVPIIKLKANGYTVDGDQKYEREPVDDIGRWKNSRSYDYITETPGVVLETTKGVFGIESLWLIFTIDNEAVIGGGRSLYAKSFKMGFGGASGSILTASCIDNTREDTKKPGEEDLLTGHAGQMSGQTIAEKCQIIATGSVHYITQMYLCLDVIFKTSW